MDTGNRPLGRRRPTTKGPLFRKSSVAALALAAVAFGGGALGQAPPLSSRVQHLLSQMTIDEKLTITQGGKDPAYLGQIGYTAGVPRLNIPEMRWTDGPVGILNGFDMTAMPQAIALAANFDPALAHRYGAVLGEEARATNIDVVLGPQLDLARTPDWGRNITSFGEDPYLMTRLAPEYVHGINEKGAMSVAKHFLGYNQAAGIGGGLNAEAGVDVILDDRQLHEIYLPSYASALKAGGNGIMASYAHVGGEWMTAQPRYLMDVLRGELKWGGFVVSDWHANHSTESVAAGLDVEMPANGPVVAVGREPPFWGDRLKAAIQAGRVPQAALDRAAGAVLTEMDQMGMLNGARVAAPPKLDIEGHAAVARATAIGGAVLLKNDGALPLKLEGARSVLVIGPTGGQLAVGPGTGRAEGIPSRIRSPLAALRAGAPNARIDYAVGDDLTGVAIPSSALQQDGGAGAGLTRSTRDGAPPTADANVDFVGHRALPPGRSVVWRGTLRVPTTGDYMIMAQSWGGATNLSVDGALKTGAARLAFGIGTPKRWSSLLPTTDNLDNGQTHLQLEAGKTYRIELTAQAESYQPMQVRLAWVTPEMRRKNVEDAVAAARRVDTPIVFAWTRGGESFDPEMNLSLPNGQDALIDAVARANPNTIVVLNTGNPVSMPWRDKVRAILEMWYPGQEGGGATADILTGKAEPGGRLPLTFPLKASDTPALAPGHPERFAGVGGKLTYSEGIFVGYRWYDENRIQPLFPFGYGLGYTRFQYSDLKVQPTADGADVSFTVKNIGASRGSDTPQVYLGAPAKPPVPMPPKTLAGFQRVELDPGQSTAVRVHLDRQAMAYWSTEKKDWVVAAGRRPILVGASSRDIKLTGAVTARP